MRVLILAATLALVAGNAHAAACKVEAVLVGEGLEAVVERGECVRQGGPA